MRYVHDLRVDDIPARKGIFPSMLFPCFSQVSGVHRRNLSFQTFTESHPVLRLHSIPRSNGDSVRVSLSLVSVRSATEGRFHSAPISDRLHHNFGPPFLHADLILSNQFSSESIRPCMSPGRLISAPAYILRFIFVFWDFNSWSRFASYRELIVSGMGENLAFWRLSKSRRTCWQFYPLLLARGETIGSPRELFRLPSAFGYGGDFIPVFLT
ncbi:hypothetical protein B0H19DRAFT_435297 [Mycena capillaripes]|nr:hypothetical protein B0H19DRAFT_435297 [Mycena capillaripes]